ncbi:mechanosensitive ion channel family protein [Parapedobacter tibetensis]|uniref:mechanosensitive ion channel family protein n=1 Tax=Parapedobacter tibetensis TaxID=2972951 RepID=UPI00214D9E8C|nr:mechanosensitive ion channel family protein [Parapedobacter tibetensis]
MMTYLNDFFADTPDIVWNLLIIGLAILAGFLLKVILIPLLRLKAIDDGVYSLFRSAVRHLNKIVNVLLPLLFFNSLIPFMRLSAEEHNLVNKAIEIALICCFSVVLIRIIRIAEDYFNHRFDYRMSDNLRARKVRTQIQFIRQLLIVIVVIITVAIILLSFDSMQRIGAGLLTGVGLGGIIIGFAAQKSLGNLLAGFQIAFTQPIRIDDVLVVEGEWGKIEEINLTYVVLNIWDKRRLVLPIQYFIEKPFQNWTRTSAEMLGTVSIYVDYTVPLAPLREELSRLLKGHPLWDGQVDILQVTDLKERTMEVRALMSCRNSGDAWDLRCYIREKLIDFIQAHYPESLSKTRIEMDNPLSNHPPELVHGA